MGRWLARGLVAMVAVIAVGSAPAAATTTNLLTNGDFETGTTSGWAAQSSTLAAVPGGHSGLYAGQATNGTATNFGLTANPAPVVKATTAGTVYTATGWVKTQNAVGKSVCLRVIEIAASGSQLATPTSCIVMSTTWQAFPAIDYVAQQSGSTIKYRIYEKGAVAGNAYQVDDLGLTASSGGSTAPAPPALSGQAVSSSEIDLSWTEASSGIASYAVYRDGSLATTVAGTQQSFNDTGLAAGSTHSYVVHAIDTAGQDSGPSNTVTRTTQSGGGVSGQTIAAAGDIACDPKSASFNGGDGTAKACQQKWTAQEVQGMGVDAVLPLGDLVYDCGGPAEFSGSYDPSWGAFKGISYPAIGNHEYQATSTVDTDCTPNGSGYYNYWGATAGDPSKGYYSWTLGSWLMVSLNANCKIVSCAATSPQVSWLKQQLSATSQPCILAYWHQPLFSSAGGATAGTKPFWNALYAAHADVVLNGHAHVYERYPKQNPSGTADSAGIREFIVGTGGNSHGKMQTTPPAGAVFDATTYGVMKMTLGASSYSWSFQPDGHSGSFTDSGSESCN